MTRTETISRAKHDQILTAAQQHWHESPGRFLIDHSDWTYREFTAAYRDLERALQDAFGRSFFLAGQKPDDFDNDRPVEMSDAAYKLFLTIEADLANV